MIYIPPCAHIPETVQCQRLTCECSGVRDTHYMTRIQRVVRDYIIAVQTFRTVVTRYHTETSDYGDDYTIHPYDPIDCSRYSCNPHPRVCSEDPLRGSYCYHYDDEDTGIRTYYRY